MAAGTNVSFSTPKGPAGGWLVRPGSGRPGVIVLQEWWGLVPHIEDVAERYLVSSLQSAIAAMRTSKSKCTSSILRTKSSKSCLGRMPRS